MKGKYLITTDAWFYAPDGKMYRAVWGDVEILEDSLLGLKTNRNSTNWYAKVGSDDNHVIVAGCQIHYATKCLESPNTKPVADYSTEGGSLKWFERPTGIYIAN
ncbi:hypothetical protein [Pontibacter rugosus]|uniref:Uncharacterized protein n=1 Tax=Pontibacter rugosus TaxID=1745966 RepID=A0ABW3SKX2_9BACT